MIVDPDFPDHWKTRMLVNLLGGDEASPVYLIRLWAHCQLRRQWTFEGLTPEALKALCRFPGHANKLDSSLSTSGFVRRTGTALEVLNWADYNASLIAAWGNGSKGGRPKKPPETTGEPDGNPWVSDKRRGDKKGVLKEEEPNDGDSSPLEENGAPPARSSVPTQDGDTEPAALAGEFSFYQAGGRYGSKRDEPRDIEPQVAEMLRLGLTAKKFRDALHDPKRDRGEFFWEFKKRVFEKGGGANGQRKSKRFVAPG